MTEALKEWRDAREAIFKNADKATPQMWSRLANAEHALMKLAREIA